MSEKGHAIIVANFEELIVFVVSLGAVYNPANPSLRLEALQNLLAAAKTAINDVNVTRAAKINAVNRCQQIFARLGPLSTRFSLAFQVCGAEENARRSLRQYVRKIQGVRASERVRDNPETPGIDESQQNHSASQMSRTSRIEHLDRAIAYIKATGIYNVNEEEMQVPALEAFSAELKAAHYAAEEAKVDFQLAVGDRNKLLYLDKMSLIETAKLVKTYLKLLFRDTPERCRHIYKLQFDKPPRF